MRITDVVKNLLIINVLFFIATYFLFDQQKMLDLLALHYPFPNLLQPAEKLFQPIQIVTHFFMHGGIGHIFFNMFALVMFGSALEAQWGPRRFLFFYLFCAFGAAALHMGYSWYNINGLQELIEQFKNTGSAEYFQTFIKENSLSHLRYNNGENAEAFAKEILVNLRAGSAQAVADANYLMETYYEGKVNVPVVGASGAIYGLLLAFGMKFPNVELMLIFLPIPVKAKYFIPVLMLVELYLGVNQFSWDNIAHFAHLGGAVTGFFLILYWQKFGTNL